MCFKEKTAPVLKLIAMMHPDLAFFKCTTINGFRRLTQEITANNFLQLLPVTSIQILVRILVGVRSTL
jgi:hypothetical protein